MVGGGLDLGTKSELILSNVKEGGLFTRIENKLVLVGGDTGRPGIFTVVGGKEVVAFDWT